MPGMAGVDPMKAAITDAANALLNQIVNALSVGSSMVERWNFGDLGCMLLRTRFGRPAVAKFCRCMFAAAMSELTG